MCTTAPNGTIQRRRGERLDVTYTAVSEPADGQPLRLGGRLASRTNIRVSGQYGPDWLQLLVGVVLVNGITEEVIHRGFVFGHLRRGRSFAAAATSSALLFAAQHLYIIVTTGWMIGVTSLLLAVRVAYPMALVFESGGNSIARPAILHTSSNAPVLVFALPEDLLGLALVPHMGVIVVSLYLLFVVNRVLGEKPSAVTCAHM